MLLSPLHPYEDETLSLERMLDTEVIRMPCGLGPCCFWWADGDPRLGGMARFWKVA